MSVITPAVLIIIEFLGKKGYGQDLASIMSNEPRYEKTGFLHMRIQRCRSAAQ